VALVPNRSTKLLTDFAIKE